ncbi:MAG TPA: rhamnogalacturonan acetylesterase [Streptomyces sp.]|nr:rhamnogalacturonan acetylesterase [Streptomyces sp.]
MSPSSHSRRRAVAALAAVPLALAASPAAGAGPRPRRRTLHVAGDSTAAQKYASAAPETGWGMALPFFLAPHLAVANHALNGRSSLSFIEEGHLRTVLAALRPGDWLLIQFGHNDAKDDARHTDPWTTYQDCLSRYVRGARSRGARPVLLTPVERRRFDALGNAVTTHGDYPAAMRELAADEGVELVDLQATTMALWQELGPDASKDCFLWLKPGESPNYPQGVSDNTHLVPHGAVEVARLAADGLRRRVLAARDVRRLDEEIPPERIVWPPDAGARTGEAPPVVHT